MAHRGGAPSRMPAGRDAYQSHPDVSPAAFVTHCTTRRDRRSAESRQVGGRGPPPSSQRLRENHLPALRPWRHLSALCLITVLAACGGGGGSDPGASVPPAAVERPASRDDAARFLTQASFGPTEADIDRVMALGYSAWIDEQFATPATSHRAHFDARDVEIKAANATQSAGQDQVFESFWKQAATGPDQLRLRTAFALSQIFVISLTDSTVANTPRAVAAWLDMLGDKGLGRYRDLLEAVSLHPMMGVYLSHLRNQKADTRTGRVPDENYSREIMQLFSLGLLELNEDGSVKTSGGAAIETYTPADISGLARVFTGFSWNCPDWPDNSCFFSGSASGASDPDRHFKTMLGYPQYHSPEEKRFLGTTIAAQTLADPNASLRQALDAISAHANVGPFIGKQLIQRLVTSNPSPEYVRAVARVFADNGQGVRGDMRAVVKAVLMHPEARATSDTAGKVREPVLRLSSYLRAFPHRSESGYWRVGNTDNVGSSLGQTPMRSPSVFNFYRPGYVPPGTGAATRSLVVPEMQITHETSVAGYVNYMRDNIASGVGASSGGRRDIQPDFTAELALATDPAALVDRVASKLTYGTAGAALKTEIADAVGRIVIPALNAGGTNQAAIDTAKRNRVNAAVLLVIASPEYIVQK